jgi:hypothetical protein
MKISSRCHREDVRRPWILPDSDLASTAVQPSPFATDENVGMKIPECYRPEEIAVERNGTRDQLRALLSRSTS